jgi:hypothetical protein
MNPQLYTIRQRFNRPQSGNIVETVKREVALFKKCFASRAAIAVAVGSRGIAGIDQIVKAVVQVVRQTGAQPFIVPAMGSHGSGITEGQVRILAEAGITEKAIGAPIRASMEVIDLPGIDIGNRVFMDRAAYESDGVILVNRIKPHTDFHGRYESGLVKMAVIGLGKHAAAVEVHSFGVSGLAERIPLSFKKILQSGKILFGLGLVENAYDQTAYIEAIPADRILDREPELLDMARQNMPKLPVEDIDVLIVDRMGKEVSGVGMDPNIIGRLAIRGQEEPHSPRIKAILVSGLSARSYGNAIGMGLADVITRKLYNTVDFDAMYVNVRASLFLERVKVPFIAESDAEGFALALRSCGRIAQDAERIVRIRDTLSLETVQVSGAILDELGSSVEVTSDARPIFDDRGELVKVFED